MSKRSELEKRLIQECRNVLDVTEEYDPDSDAMKDEIKFIRYMLDEWEEKGAIIACRNCADALKIGQQRRKS